MQITLDANRTIFIRKASHTSVEFLLDGETEMTTEIQLYIRAGNSVCEEIKDLMLKRIQKAGGSATYTAE